MSIVLNPNLGKKFAGNFNRAKGSQQATGVFSDLTDMVGKIKDPNAKKTHEASEVNGKIADSMAIFGAPPKYSNLVDIDDRIYNKLWGGESLEKTIPITIRVGSPQPMTFSNVNNLVTNVAGRAADATDSAYNLYKKSIDNIKELEITNSIRSVLPISDDSYEPEPDLPPSESKPETASREANSFNLLDTYRFGPVARSAAGGGNAYFDTVNLLLECMALGLKSQGVPDSANPYLDPYLRVFGSTSLTNESNRNPSFTIIGSEETSMTESINNEIGASALENIGNKSSETAREMNFMFDGNFMTGLAGMVADVTGVDAGKIASSIKSTVDAFIGSVNKNLGTKDVFQIISKGSQLFIPKVWKGSSFDKKYSISFRLNSPGGDNYSIARYVGIPLAHIIAASAPSQTSTHSVNKPFLVQIDSPGMMAVRMGMVTSMTMRKGGRDNVWSNKFGLSRSMDITLDIADLFEILPAPARYHDALSNEQTRDFLSNVAGGRMTSDIKKARSEFAEMHYLTAPNYINDKVDLKYETEENEIFANKVGLNDINGMLQGLGGLTGSKDITKAGIMLQQTTGATGALTGQIGDAIGPILGMGAKAK